MSRMLGLALALAMTGGMVHAGTKRCPALQAGQGQLCDCVVQNYGTKDITVSGFRRSRGGRRNDGAARHSVPQTVIVPC